MRYTLIAIAILLAILQVDAQVNLSLNVSAPPGPHLSGETFLVTLQYSCASTAGEARNARIEVPIASELRYRGALPTAHIAASGYDESTSVAWFEFVDPLGGGAGGEIGLQIRFPWGVTPNNSTINLTGTFTADNAISRTSTTSVTSSASLSSSVEKTLANAARVAALSGANSTLALDQSLRFDYKTRVDEDVLADYKACNNCLYSKGSNANSEAYPLSGYFTDEIQNEGAGAGVAGLEKELSKLSGITLADQFTRVGFSGLSGKYVFDNFTLSNYQICLLAAAIATYGPERADLDLFADSNVDPVTGTNTTLALTANQYNNDVDINSSSRPTEVCGNGIDDNGDSSIACPCITGYVFEDINYGGGAGRSFAEANNSAIASSWADSAIAIVGTAVELYSGTGAPLQKTWTNARGKFVFENVSTGDYIVRVVTSTVVSNRTIDHGGAALLPVMTYRDYDGTQIRNEVGGQNRQFPDAPGNPGTLNWAALTTSSSAPHAFSAITYTIGSNPILNFGFNFNTITNHNDSGQGSLRQFSVNANRLSNTNIDQVDAPPGRNVIAKPNGWDVSVFELGSAGVHDLNISTQIDLRDKRTHLCGYTQLGSRPGTFDSRQTTIQLIGLNDTKDGLGIFEDDVTVSGLSLTGFNRVIEALGSNKTGLFVWGNTIGLRADGNTAGQNRAPGVFTYTQSQGFIGTNGDGENDDYEGNVISNSFEGIRLQITSDMLIAGNRIGTNQAGTTDHGNVTYGILLRDCTASNVIGYDDRMPNLTSANARNIVSGNDSDGIRMYQAVNQIIAGNYIGTNANGLSAIPNRGDGVQIMVGSHRTIVGTDGDGNGDVEERNVISGNGIGVEIITLLSSNDCRISGNYIGVDRTGNAALPNLTHGIDLAEYNSNLIVGSNGDGVRDAVEANVISGNMEDGIHITAGVDINISGNKIGVGADGTSNVGNGKRGIFIEGTSTRTVIGYSSTMSNQSANEVGNTIRYNGDCGIGQQSSAQDVLMRRNSFGYNNGLSIDLNYDLVSPNDNGDGDTGPNGLLNYPIISKIDRIGDFLAIEGFTRPGTLVEFYVADGLPNPAPLPVGYTSSFGEGAAYLTSGTEGSSEDTDAAVQSYADNGTGANSPITEAKFKFTLPIATYQHLLGDGFMITATATDRAAHATSEFSPTIKLIYLENCTNNVDDDGDGLVDCADHNCPSANQVHRVNQVTP